MSLRNMVCACLFLLTTTGARAEDDRPAPSQPGGKAKSGEQAESALAVFRQRILPIMQAKNPSSCSECHLSGVDLKDYIRDDQTKTFAALRDAGLLNVKQPDESKLLKLINRRPEKPNLLTDKVRQQEFEAFRAWIRAAVKDVKLTAAKTADEKLGPQVAPEVIRHARQDRVLASFIDNVWSEVGRCAACHSPDRNQKQVKEHSEQVSWIKLGDPRATLAYMLEADLIDLAQPDQSQLLLKPTNQVKHGGGQKLVIGDRTYKQFRQFIEDYAASQRGDYKSPTDLPTPRTEVSAVTDIWFKLSDVPARLDKLVLQVDLFRFDEQTKAWSIDRWATADRAIWGGGQLWQQHLSVTAPRDAERARSISTRPTLPPGRYLAKIYLDEQGKLQSDYPYELGAAEFVGQVELDTRWPAGYGHMTVARFPEKR